jgi:phosphohistidine phosphatase
MRHLFLFRHAEAVPISKLSDRERPLSADGRQAATRVGAFLALTRQKIDLVLVSDSARTQETWKLAQAEFGGAPEVRIEKDLYHAGPGDVMAELRELPDSAEAAMIVGHNPALGEFASRFAGSGDRPALTRLERGFPPGGLAIFNVHVDEWRKLRWDGGELALFLT